MENVSTFRGLSGKQAKAKFASDVLYTMTTNDITKIEDIFNEGQAGKILDTEILNSLQKKAKEILPVKLVYENNEKEDMQKFAEYRDEMLKACECYR